MNTTVTTKIETWAAANPDLTAFCLEAADQMLTALDKLDAEGFRRWDWDEFSTLDIMYWAEWHRKIELGEKDDSRAIPNDALGFHKWLDKYRPALTALVTARPKPEGQPKRQGRPSVTTKDYIRFQPHPRKYASNADRQRAYRKRNRFS